MNEPMVSSEKEVNFYEYCRTCKYLHTSDFEDPCNTCLESPTNEWSHKPILYERKDEINEDSKPVETPSNNFEEAQS